MGATKTDLLAKERSLDAKYDSVTGPALNSATGLRILLSDWHALRLRRFNGDYDASVILLDLETAIALAKLTAKQRQALALVYFEDLAPKDAGLRMKCTRQAVEQFVERALEEIAEVFYYWSGHGEGYCVGKSLIQPEGETV